MRAKRQKKVLILLAVVVVLLGLTLLFPLRAGEHKNTEPTSEPGTLAVETTNAPDPAIPAANGIVTAANGTTSYYIDGNLQKDAIVGSDAEGFYYANADGIIDMGYCDQVSYNGETWNVINGKASRVESDWDITLGYALKDVAKCTDSSMTKDEKLRAAFDYIKGAYLEGVLHDPPYNEPDWPVVCANDLFVEGKGDCFSYGAAFAFYGKAIGCEECYACNTGGHGWAEIDGKAYDPEWDSHHQEYNHFGVSPGDDCDVSYFGGFIEAEGYEWMHVKL